MATTISNPATFSSVRNAFSTEGYGTSTSFFAYRQGGGIVPDTSAFNVIGAGTAGDPLQLSQFNGFTVPGSLAVSLDNHTLEAVATSYLGAAASAICYFRLNSNGQAVFQYVFGGNESSQFEAILDTISVSGTPGNTVIETWLDSGAAGDVSVYVTKTGSNLFTTSDALSTYLTLDTNRLWAVRAQRVSSGAASASAILTVTLVQTSNTANVLDTAQINIIADAVSSDGLPP